MNRIAIFGASGLIGHALACRILRENLPLLAIARGFAPAQQSALTDSALTCQPLELSVTALADVLRDNAVDIVVNCIGVLQDAHAVSTVEVHHAFVGRLLQAINQSGRSTLLIHLSVPGTAASDRTAFSRSKRDAERMIEAAGVPYVIIRPGFVLAEPAYGGSALLRALAMTPFKLPPSLARRPLSVTAMRDIEDAVLTATTRWREGTNSPQDVWDVCSAEPTTVADVADRLRRRLGGPDAAITLPDRLLDATARMGDLASQLGWRPPVRSTALAELRRGVSGDPATWIRSRQAQPSDLAKALSALPSTVQERWFSRLYLLKPLVIASLSVFWLASGLIALLVSFGAAADVLSRHGFGSAPARFVTIVTSLMDIGIGLALAHRRTCRIGLLSGIGLSLAYMCSAAILAPDLWVEPLGALVKTGPAIVLMVVALAILDSR